MVLGRSSPSAGTEKTRSPDAPRALSQHLARPDVQAVRWVGELPCRPRAPGPPGSLTCLCAFPSEAQRYGGAQRLLWGEET